MRAAIALAAALLVAAACGDATDPAPDAGPVEAADAADDWCWPRSHCGARRLWQTCRCDYECACDLICRRSEVGTSPQTYCAPPLRDN